MGVMRCFVVWLAGSKNIYYAVAFIDDKILSEEHGKIPLCSPGHALDMNRGGDYKRVSLCHTEHDPRICKRYLLI